MIKKVLYVNDLEVLRSRVAADLLAIGAVSLAPETPYVWASGRRAPIYCDNRLTLAYPQVRRLLTQGFRALIEHYSLTPDIVAGTATAGIPHAAWLAEALNLPMAYIRAQAKAHGRGNQIEGKIEPHKEVLIIEDLVSTGGSSLAAVEAVRAVGAEVMAVCAVFSYEFPEAHRAFAEADVPLYVLTGYGALLAVAQERGTITPEQARHLADWRQDPEAWSARWEAQQD